MNRTILTSATSALSLMSMAAPASADLITVPSTVNFGPLLVNVDPAATATVEATRGDQSGAITVTFPVLSAPFSRSGASLTSKIGVSSNLTGRSVTFSPTTRGTTTTNWLISAQQGTGPVETDTVTLSGVAVAPQVSITTVNAVARAGTAAIDAATVAIKNVGDGNLSSQPASISNLKGSVGAVSPTNPFIGSGGTFNLADGGTQTFSFTYAASATRATDTATVTVSTNNGSADGTNQASSTAVTVTGESQGPVYQATPWWSSTPMNSGDDILFGGVGNGLMTQTLMISNITPDTGAQSLTNMTITASIINDPGSEFSFSLGGFDSQTLTTGVLKSATNNGGVFDIGQIAIQFAAKAGFSGTAQLKIQTDENSALGVMGSNVYVYDLIGTVPEPGTLMVLGTGLLGLALSRRRRGRNEPALLTAGNDPD
jgi:hypothetical protein